MQGVIFIGLQASGKSSFYSNNFLKTSIRLNMDMLKTRHRENILLEACLESKQPVVIDNTNPTKKDREKYISRFKAHKFEILGYYFSSKLHDCLERNSLRTGKELVPEVGLKATSKKLVPPNYSEGFDRLYYVSLIENGFKVTEWENEI